MRLIAVTFWLVAVGIAANAACAPDIIRLRGDWGQTQFQVEIADTDETRAQGLMFRESLPQFAGMVFVYPRPHRARFWMKNTLIPLDMLFLDASGVVRRIHSMAEPRSLAVIEGGPGITVVLEINGGLAEKLGIAEGSQARYPAFGDDAVWACTTE